MTITNNIRNISLKYAFALLFLLFPVSFSYGENSPQQIIAHFEKEIQGVSPEKKDSVKNALQSNYIQEYRNIGKEAALDSLQARVNRLLNIKKTHTVKNRSASSPPEPIISNGVERTKRIADSLTIEMLKTREKALIEPIYFDAISHTDFFDYFKVTKPTFKSTVDTTQSKYNFLAQKSAAFQFQNKQKRRTVNTLAVTYPELIEYYSLSSYDDKARDITSGKALTVNVDEYRTMPGFDKPKNFRKPEKQSNWSSNGKLSMQFSQYYVTKNWHKGGEPNATLLSLLEYHKDYNNNDKLIWNNGLDVRIGFFNSGIDTLRAFRVNNDVFKITTRLGYRTFHKKWYYSAYGEFNTCMFTGYAGTNSSDVVTAFLSPTRIFTSLGLDYRYNRNTVVLIAPLAHKLIFLVSDRIDPLSVGIANGKSSSGFGYMLQAKTNWQFTREISVNSNFNLFSTYDFKNVEFNWETVGNFTINRYLSTRLSLNMRFDNTPKKPEKGNFEKPRLQIQEQLSFGFYYRI